MRVFSANRFRALVLISEIAAAEKGSSRKARHWPARRSSAGSVEGVRSLFRERSLLGEDLESTFSCRIAPPVVQFFRNDASEWTGRRRRRPGRIAFVLQPAGIDIQPIEKPTFAEGEGIWI